MSEAVERAQGYAISIEDEMKQVFGCERYGVASIVDSDFIRRNPLAAILATCGFIYASVDEREKKQVEEFIKDTRFYWEMRLDELLSFKTSSKTVEKKTIEIEYENGENALEDIINEFRGICNLIR